MAQLPIRQPDWIPNAPVVVRRSLRLAVPAAAAWERIADHETWPEWFTTLRRVRVTDATAGVGGRREVSVPGVTLGEVFTAWEPEQRFAFSVVSAPRLLASMAEVLEITDADHSGCTLTYTQGIEPAAWFGWFWWLASKRSGRDLERALARLADLLAA